MNAGCAPGTEISVSNLFFNTPVRRKFLKSDDTEAGHVEHQVRLHALAFPEVRFTLIRDGQQVFDVPATHDLRQRIADFVGRETASALMRIRPTEAPGVRVSGYLMPMSAARRNRRMQYVFLNGRPIEDQIINRAVRDGYGGFPPGLHPALFLYLEVEPALVDVNVHPAKREVRFRNPAAVKTAIIEAIGKSLCPTSAQPAEPAEEVSFLEKISILKPEAKPAEPPAAIQTPAPIPPPEEPKPQQLEFAVDENSTSARPWRYFRFLAQSESGYLLIETDAGIVTINPIAARERIAFERLMHRGGTGKIASQTLLIPKTLQFSPVEFARIKSSLEAIRGMGFQIEEFGAATFKIEAVPQLIESLSPASILSTIARDLAEGRTRKSGEKWREEIIARSIARSFAGASIKLDEKGGTRLVEELSSCRMPYVCPRGKPVMIFTSNSELNRKFNLA